MEALRMSKSPHTTKFVTCRIHKDKRITMSSVPPPPTFRAPTRESILMQKGVKPSPMMMEEDLSFMDAEVR